MPGQGDTARPPEDWADPRIVRPPQGLEEEPGAGGEEAGGGEVPVGGGLLQVGFVGDPVGLYDLDVYANAPVAGGLEVDADVFVAAEGVVAEGLCGDGLDWDFVEPSFPVVDEFEERHGDVGRGPEGEGDVFGVGHGREAVAPLKGIVSGVRHHLEGPFLPGVELEVPPVARGGGQQNDGQERCLDCPAVHCTPCNFQR